MTIGSVERYLTDKAWEMGWVKPIRRQGRERGQSVGIVGAGPAGLAAAEKLREKGYAVTVYDRYDRAGGLLIYGIPGFKLEKDVVERRTAAPGRGRRRVQAGLRGRPATPPCADLRDKHDAVLIATGVYAARDLTAPGAGNQGVVPALRLPDRLQPQGPGRRRAGLRVSGVLNAEGKDVVVVGGGDTAMDCVRTAIRQDATLGHLPLSPRQAPTCPARCARCPTPRKKAWSSNGWPRPRAVLGRRRRRHRRARRPHARWAPRTPRAARRPEEVDGGDFDLPAQLVIKALGFDPEDLPAACSASRT